MNISKGVDKKDVTISLRRRVQGESLTSQENWCTITFHGDPDIQRYDNITYHLEQFYAALGISKRDIDTIIGISSEEYRGGLGPGGFFRHSIITAQKTALLVEGLHTGIARLREEAD